MRCRSLSFKYKNTVTAIIIFFSIITKCWGADYYVDKSSINANDSNQGTTEIKPWKTIQKAANTLKAGDTVHVKAGVYYESIILSNSGSADLKITYKNFKNDTVVVDGSKTSDSRLIHWNADGKFKHHIVWDGIDVRNARQRGLWVAGDHNTIQNCKVYNNGHTGLQTVYTDYMKIYNCEFYGNGWNALSVEYADYADIAFNYIHDNNHHAGINLFPAIGNSIQNSNIIRHNTIVNNDTGMYFLHQNNLKIFNNVVALSNKDGIFINAGGNSAKIFNNTITNNGRSGYGYGVNNITSRKVDIRNNIIAYNSSGQINMAITSDSNINFNLYYPAVKIRWNGKLYSSLLSLQQGASQEKNGINLDPFFMDTNKKDFSISSKSPVIDKGEYLFSEGITDDIRGVSRNTGYGFDIGAYEYGDVNFSLKPPLNLRYLK